VPLSAPRATGRLAERLRRTPWYRERRVFFVSLSPLLHQVRINVLADGKTLLMPSPSLRQGFLVFPARSVPFGKIPQAVTPKGAVRFGRRLTGGELRQWPVAVAVAEALLVDRRGVRLGAGDGFFDLALGILAAWQGLSEDLVTVACLAAADRLIDGPLPAEPFDVPVQVAASHEGVVALDVAPPSPRIWWEYLDRRRIRRIDPLWKLWRDRPAVDGSAG